MISRRAFAAAAASVATVGCSPAGGQSRPATAGPNVFNLLDYIPRELHRGIRERTYFGDVSRFEQAALDDLRDRGGGRLHRPAGWYPWRSTVRGDAHNIVLTGDGRATSLIIPMADIGDGYHFRPPRGAANVQGLEFHDFGFYTQVDTTSGSLLRLTQANNFVVGSVSLQAHYCGLYLEGATHGVVDGKCNIASDANFKAFRPGSSLLRVGQGDTDTLPAEIHVGSVDWRGQTGNFNLEHSVLVEDVDGLWFTQPHLGFSRNGFSVTPRNDRSILYSINIDQGYIDTVGEHGLRIVDPTGRYAGGFGLHDFDLTTIHKTGKDGVFVYLDSGAAQMKKSRFAIAGTENIGENGFNCGRGRAIEIKDGFTLGNLSTRKRRDCGGVVLQGRIDDVRIGKGLIERGDSANIPTWGVFIGPQVSRLTLDQIRIRGCEVPIADNSPANAQKVIAAPLLF